jgi:hypothetical protein
VIATRVSRGRCWETTMRFHIRGGCAQGDHAPKQVREPFFLSLPHPRF